jgi:hypothetical protein
MNRPCCILCQGEGGEGREQHNLGLAVGIKEGPPRVSPLKLNNLQVGRGTDGHPVNVFTTRPILMESFSPGTTARVGAFLSPIVVQPSHISRPCSPSSMVALPW